MKTPNNRAVYTKPLIHLPNGTWIRPETVTAIRPTAANAGHPDRAVVYHSEGQDVIPFPSLEEAKWFCDQLSAEINKPV
jgi:hypothetical protein